MNNIDIVRHAAEFARSRRAERLAPDDAWHQWSNQFGITGPAARYIFEAEYQQQLEGGSRH